MPRNLNSGTKEQTTKLSCPVCSSSGVFVFFEVRNAPVFCNVLYNTQDEALAAARAPVRLGYCSDCGLIYNLAFDPQLVRYVPGYENSLHFSEHFQNYASRLANELIDKYDLHDKDIVEIGCGGGEFLGMLCSYGGNRGVGFDPSWHKEKQQSQWDDCNVTIVAKSFGESNGVHPADFICCRHVLEHVDEPLAFLRNIRRTVGSEGGCQIYFEVPNAMFIVRQGGVWDVIYEHFCYFTCESAKNLFEMAGFEQVEVSERYGGQFIGIEARVAKNGVRGDSIQISGDIIELVRNFEKGHKKIIRQWQRRLREFEKSHKRLVIWGAGSKGVMFLNKLEVSSTRIPYAVDVNPRKHNRFIPGTAQKVVSPEFLEQYRPNVIVVLNQIYVPEIRQMLEKQGIECDLIVA